MVSETGEKQKRVVGLFEYVALTTRSKFGLRVQRDPSLIGLGILGRGELFNCFHPEHLNEARILYEALIAAHSFDDFLDLSHQARDYVNQGLFLYAVSVAILHRDDCRGVSLPPIQEVFPNKFIPAETLSKALVDAEQHPDTEVDIITDMEFVGNILDPEYLLSYYREDIGINAHHWHWHLVYPATWRADITGKTMDRKGELFYYMHQQMCARYDCERLSNGMPRVIPFHNFTEKLHGFSSHLSSGISGKHYSSRAEGLILQDLSDVTVQDMERWRDRILDAINLGFVTDEHGRETVLDETSGIDILGDIIESSYESVNKSFYGSLHNWGHVMIGDIQDPEGKYQTPSGVMSDTATSLQDPIFYRWHRFIDNIFLEYKSKLHSYNKDDLSFNGVEIVNVQLKENPDKIVSTTFKKDLLNLSYAYYLDRKGDIKVRYEHLDHDPFTYEIAVENHSRKTKHATVRIFLAPKYDELGNELSPNELRRLMIELDKFRAELHPGNNVIERKSSESSVTLSTERSFGELLHGEGANDNADEFCSCGWPQHLLIPKGNSRGMEFHLFVMVTDWLQDTVTSGHSQAICVDAVSYCGAKDQLYPDRKPMGFPFDRIIEAKTMKEWLYPNMEDVIVTIKHH
uniref:Hemocyanin subunit c n=1 Tax=Euphrynichus bacillifer TaxID=317672 RepID=G8YZR3_9ARAC|nr:hemocyanin subunit c [Euphrynichus bacillifer]